MFYSAEEFEAVVVDLISTLGMSREDAVIQACTFEREDAEEYDRWLDSEDEDREIFAEFG